MTPSQKAVYLAAINWYKQDKKAGCVRDNFGDQTQKLWDACVFDQEPKRYKSLYESFSEKIKREYEETYQEN